jgi:hypothetical protein
LTGVGHLARLQCYRRWTATSLGRGRLKRKNIDGTSRIARRSARYSRAATKKSLKFVE